MYSYTIGLTGSLAELLGLEPRMAESKSAVLPLHHSSTETGAGYRNRTDDERLEIFSFAPKLIPHNTLVPRAGIEPARLAARDFKSRMSTYFITKAIQLVPQERLELSHLTVLASKTSVSANSTIRAILGGPSRA